MSPHPSPVMIAIPTRLAGRSVTRCARVAALAAALLAGLTAGACTTDREGPPGETSAAAPTMTAVMTEVLAPRCTFSSCHSAPTVAAKLDLSPERACSALVNTASCLFPQRTLVVPGDPDASFLMHKLTGAQLTDLPDGACASSTNAPMPFGGSALPGKEIELVRAWIEAGAPCAGAPPPPPSGAPSITSLMVDRTAPLAGDVVTFTVTLDRPAPEGGQAIALETDAHALSAPIQVHVPAGQSEVTFDAYAQQPASLFMLVARAGASARAAQIRVGGLEVAEVLADAGHGDHSQWVKLRNRSTLPIALTDLRLQIGQASYTLISAPLTGTLAPGKCVVVGDMTGPPPSGDPVTFQQVDFTPDLPTAGAQAAGYALFEGNAAATGAPPMDTLLVGPSNAARLMDPDGQPATPGCATPPAGSSARRTGPISCLPAAPQPTLCP